MCIGNKDELANIAIEELLVILFRESDRHNAEHNEVIAAAREAEEEAIRIAAAMEAQREAERMVVNEFFLNQYATDARTTNRRWC